MNVILVLRLLSRSSQEDLLVVRVFTGVAVSLGCSMLIGSEESPGVTVRIGSEVMVGLRLLLLDLIRLGWDSGVFTKP